MQHPLGVGFVGAGPVTQAIHLPVVAAMPERLAVVHVMDSDARLAAVVASRVAARHTDCLERLLDDPNVDIVVICSPDRFHADQVCAACAAGKKLILSEKPLATSSEDAHRIAAACRSSGTPLIVGTMHAYDPAVVAALDRWEELEVSADLVRSMIFLPSNDLFVNAATQLASASAVAPGDAPPDETLRRAILGLATHAVPIIRPFAPDLVTVERALRFDPLGYLMVLDDGRCTVELAALMPGAWQPSWRLEVFAPQTALEIDFTPSYVLAGSATATLQADGRDEVWRFPHNGYQAEWELAADVALGRAAPTIPLETVTADIDYALRLADATERRLRFDT